MALHDHPSSFLGGQQGGQPGGGFLSAQGGQLGSPGGQLGGQPGGGDMRQELQDPAVRQQLKQQLLGVLQIIETIDQEQAQRGGGLGAGPPQGAGAPVNQGGF